MNLSLYELREVLSSRALGPRDIARSALEAAAAVVGAARGAVLIEERGRGLRVEASIGFPSDFDPSSPADPAARVIEDALRGERPVVRERVPGRAGGPARAALASPLDVVVGPQVRELIERSIMERPEPGALARFSRKSSDITSGARAVTKG